MYYIIRSIYAEQTDNFQLFIAGWYVFMLQEQGTAPNTLFESSRTLNWKNCRYDSLHDAIKGKQS